MSEPAIPSPIHPAAASAAPAPGWGYAASLALVALVTAIGTLLFAHGNIADIGLLYLIPVMFAGTRHGLRTGVVTGLASSLAYNFFFIPPVHTLTVDNPAHLITLLVLLGVAFVGSQMAARVREQADLAQANADRDAALAGFARRLMGISRRADLWPVLAGEVARLFDVRAVVLAPDDAAALVLVASSPPSGPVDLLESVSAQWCLDNGRPAGPGAETLTASEWLFHPVPGADRALAVVGIARADAGLPLRADRVPLLASLLDQAGLALSRIAVEEEMIALGKVQERDRLRAALLSSVSHDLRTPLTTMLGTLRAIRAQGPEQEAQLATARAEGERLTRFVANLLDMVRIETGALERQAEAVDLAEAVDAAVDDLRRTLAARAVVVEVARDLPLVLADPRLLHHCLINLIDNAAKHGGAGGPITVRAAMGAEGLDLMVLDDGPGLPPGEEERIFGMFARIEGSDRTGGTGLGLAIVKGFAEAMGLVVHAANRSDAPGACFTLHAPGKLLRRIEEQA